MEALFKFLGLGALLIGLGFLAFFFYTLLANGYTALRQTRVLLDVKLDAAVIDPESKSTYSDEWVGGIEFEVMPSVSLGVRYIHRNLAQILEDWQPAPVVAFDLVETRVSCGDTALYAAKNCPEELAGLIARLADDFELRRAMGLRGRRRIEEELAWKFSEAPYLGMYRQVLGLPAGGASGGAASAAAREADEARKKVVAL